MQPTEGISLIMSLLHSLVVHQKITKVKIVRNRLDQVITVKARRSRLWLFTVKLWRLWFKVLKVLYFRLSKRGELSIKEAPLSSILLWIIIKTSVYKCTVWTHCTDVHWGCSPTLTLLVGWELVSTLIQTEIFFTLHWNSVQNTLWLSVKAATVSCVRHQVFFSLTRFIIRGTLCCWLLLRWTSSCCSSVVVLLLLLILLNIPRETQGPILSMLIVI